MCSKDNCKKPTAATIAAVSTPPGVSALAVIRITGPEAADCCQLLFKPANSHFLDPLKMTGYTLAYGNWYATPEQTELLDQVVLACFRAPHSYTGEDVFEISCHGSLYGVQAILDSIYQLGVTPAGPGEFSKRAFINGKLDLTKAEAVIDLIETESKERSKYALRQLQGAIKEQVQALSEALYGELARLELMLEFPEFEDTPQVRELLLSNLSEVGDKAASLSDGYRRGRMIREGIKVALVGKPNAGKSTLFNDLLAADKAIVTDIPGTTRDTIEGRLIIDGMIVTLIDTAGLRETLDPVEQVGVERSRSALSTADQVLWLIDSDSDETEIASQATEITNLSVPIIVVLSRSDLTTADKMSASIAIVERLTGRRPLIYSHKNPEQLPILRSALLDVYRELAHGDAEVVTNARHSRHFRAVADLLAEAKNLIEQNMPLEIGASVLRSAIEQLAEITGEQVSETLVENIFSRFCVGK